MGCRHNRNVSQNLASTAIQLDSKFSSPKQCFRFKGLKRFSDEEWLGLWRLQNCILKETSQSLQLSFALSLDTLRVFMLLSEDETSGHFDLLPAHFRKSSKAQIIRGCFAF